MEVILLYVMYILSYMWNFYMPLILTTETQCGHT